MMKTKDAPAVEKAAPESLPLPAVGGSWTIEELESLAAEAARRGVTPALVAHERRERGEG